MEKFPKGNFFDQFEARGSGRYPDWYPQIVPSNLADDLVDMAYAPDRDDAVVRDQNGEIFTREVSVVDKAGYIIPEEVSDEEPIRELILERELPIPKKELPEETPRISIAPRSISGEFAETLVPPKEDITEEDIGEDTGVPAKIPWALIGLAAVGVLLLIKR